ncbi:hypothetical protein OKW29_001534 [Paraburkholderia sp. CI3]
MTPSYRVRATRSAPNEGRARHEAYSYQRHSYGPQLRMTVPQPAIPCGLFLCGQPSVSSWSARLNVRANMPTFATRSGECQHSLLANESCRPIAAFGVSARSTAASKSPPVNRATPTAGRCSGPRCRLRMHLHASMRKSDLMFTNPRGKHDRSLPTDRTRSIQVSLAHPGPSARSERLHLPLRPRNIEIAGPHGVDGITSLTRRCRKAG